MLLARDNSLMIGFVLIMLLVLAGPLALVAGVDSRVDDRSRQGRPGIR
jgi:hypothetical protein